eukprot:gene8629-6060_t
MHIAKISPPVFCLVWHFIVNISTIIMAYNVFAVHDTVLEKVFLAFCIVSVVAYGTVAGPLFVYAYKYGASPAARSGSLLAGIAVMFLLSSVPIVVTMLVIILQRVYVLYYTLFVGSFSLHSVAFVIGLFISWFGYMRAVCNSFHRWRGPERQIPPQGSVSLAVIPVPPASANYPDLI